MIWSATSRGVWKQFGGTFWRQNCLGFFLMFTDNKADLLGVGPYPRDVKVLTPGEPYQLLKVSPQWFVSHTMVRINRMTFTSGAKATVSVFVCPVGITPSSWLTMLTESNWDTMNGWMMDRCSVDTGGIHETIPCSTMDWYRLDPDDAVFVVAHGQFAITDVAIDLVLPTYEEIRYLPATKISDPLPRAPRSQVSYEYATIRAAKRHTSEREKIDKWLEKCPHSYINRIMEWVDEEEKDLTDSDK